MIRCVVLYVQTDTIGLYDKNIEELQLSLHLFLNVLPTDSPADIMVKLKSDFAIHASRNETREAPAKPLDTFLFCQHGRERIP
jgi:hypothetical protein